jgi:carboxypeptidase Taq
VSSSLEALLASLHEIADLGRSRALLEWDERTMMPPGGAAVRAEQLATLTRLRHQRLASDELGRLLDAARAELPSEDSDGFAARLVAIGRREWEKARRVPAELRAETARAASLGETAWESARAANDFAALLPHLDRVIELRRRYVECFEFDHPYDPLLDDFEPGMTTGELEPVLDRLRAGALELLAELEASGAEVDSSCLYGEFDVARQAELARAVAALLPLEPGSWRLDETVHPFLTGISASDLRITTRYDPGYVGSSLWSVIHEGGHAIYRNGIDPRLERTLLARSASLGFDESSSRLWENWVGRGRPFLGHLRPVLAEHFGSFANVDADTLYRAANRVERTLIRVEADEVTYNLHVAMRFDLERELFDGRLEAAELDEAWRARSADVVGIEPVDDADGVLQDVHWAGGSFGYFPTYSLGNVIAGQLWELAADEIGDLDGQLAAGELEPLRDFLRERVYRHGGKWLSGDLVERVTGGPLDPEPLLRQLRAKFGELYELS